MKFRPRHLVVTVVTLGTISCASINNPGTSTTTLDPVAMKTFLSRNFSNVTIVYDGLARIIAAAKGSTTSGVNFTNITGGVQGTVGYDLDGNGSMESNISAKLIYTNPALGIDGGGTFTVTGINAPYLQGTAVAALTISGGGTQVNVTSGTADLQPTYGPRITIPSVSLAITPTLQNPTVLGHADFAAGGDAGTLFFESNGSTGWRIRVTSPDFATFTVP